MNSYRDRYLISLIIPVYNAKQSISQLVSQIKKESHEQLEVIFINDGSTDQSLEILKEVSQGLVNLTIINQENYGAPYARNQGMKCARGKYLWFFDADDILEDGAIRDMLIKAEQSDADICIGNMKFVNESGKGRVRVPKYLDEISEDTTKLFFWDSFPGNKLYKREIVVRNRIFWSKVKIHQDLNFYLKFIPFCKKIEYISRILYSHVEHEKNSISATYNRNIVDAVKAVYLVQKFYEKNRLNQQFEKELEYNMVKHILIQAAKIPKVKRKDKAYVYLYFRSVLKSIDYNANPYISADFKTKINNYMRLIF